MAQFNIIPSSVAIVTKPSPPDDLVITVDELKLNCGFSSLDTDLDLIFRNLILESTNYVEEAARCFLRPVTVNESFERFPEGFKQIRLSRYPVRSIVSFSYVDYAGVTQTLVAGTDYSTWLDYNPPLVCRLGTNRWPYTKPGYIPALTIQYQAGPATVISDPQYGLNRAIKLIATATYQNEDGRERKGPLIIPPAAMSMILATGKRGL